MIKILEVIPVTIFFVFIRRMETQTHQTWESAFIFSGLAAMAVIFIFLYKKIPLDRIFLGVYLYLISGGLAFITRQWWLNNLYDRLQASGVILWITATGMAAMFFSPRGFIGVASSDTNAVRKYSYFLLLFCVLAFAVSFFYQGNELLSEIVPFISLFLLQGALRDRLIKNKFKKRVRPHPE